MIILSIDTSADETAVAITNGRKVLSNVLFSQISTHTKWGGIYPALAKRAHEERIDWVIEQTLKKFTKVEAVHPAGGQARILDKMNDIDYVAVTKGPGLAVALEVGIKKAKELAKKYNKKLIAVNHLEGHIYSSFVQNSKENPKREFQFPYLALVISGGHTEIVLWKGHLQYEVLGETLDDAAGEALDKAGKMLGLGYPAGPVIEQLARQVGNKDFHKFPRPMLNSKTLEFSFSGLKTAFYYFLNPNVIARPSPRPKQSHAEIATSSDVRRNPRDDVHYKQNIRELASSFQAAVFETLIRKTEMAIHQTQITKLVVGGGVIANLHLRKLFKDLAVKHQGEVYFPPFKYLTGDNAAMIGVAAYYRAQAGKFVEDVERLDRIPRLRLS